MFGLPPIPLYRAADRVVAGTSARSGSSQQLEQSDHRDEHARRRARPSRIALDELAPGRRDAAPAPRDGEDRRDASRTSRPSSREVHRPRAESSASARRAAEQTADIARPDPPAARDERQRARTPRAAPRARPSASPGRPGCSTDRSCPRRAPTQTTSAAIEHLHRALELHPQPLVGSRSARCSSRSKMPLHTPIRTSSRSTSARSTCTSATLRVLAEAPDLRLAGTPVDRLDDAAVPVDAQLEREPVAAARVDQALEAREVTGTPRESSCRAARPHRARGAIPAFCSSACRAALPAADRRRARREDDDAGRRRRPLAVRHRRRPFVELVQQLPVAADRDPPVRLRRRPTRGRARPSLEVELAVVGAAGSPRASSSGRPGGTTTPAADLLDRPAPSRCPPPPRRSPAGRPRGCRRAGSARRSRRARARARRRGCRRTRASRRGALAAGSP